MMDVSSLQKALLNPGIYPDRPPVIKFIETHISLLFLTGNHVYKLKKPVDFGFLDFTSLEKRKFFCEEEVKLNRRLSPAIYLGSSELRKKATGSSWKGKGNRWSMPLRWNRFLRKS